VIAYVDASVLLRVALGQPDSLPEWSTIDRGVSSALVTIESLRTLDRLRLKAKLADADVAERRAKVLELIASLETVGTLAKLASPQRNHVGSASLAQRLFAPLCGRTSSMAGRKTCFNRHVAGHRRCLDAIHLATALLWRETTGEDLTMATHDRALAIAAEAHGLRVAGAKRK
jgi:predicted nucleic acid-binding protein